MEKNLLFTINFPQSNGCGILVPSLHFRFTGDSPLTTIKIIKRVNLKSKAEKKLFILINIF
jgi:hypothetical protein